jgi:hypothetical protein
MTPVGHFQGSSRLAPVEHLLSRSDGGWAPSIVDTRRPSNHQSKKSADLACFAPIDVSLAYQIVSQVTAKVSNPFQTGGSHPISITLTDRHG